MSTMRSTFFNQLRLMFRPTSISRESALATNYTYVNEDKISRSLICAICLDPLVDPQTHAPCDNSFCNRCIKKLRTCPCCRASILNPTDMRPTGHGLRNILDELQVINLMMNVFLGNNLPFFRFNAIFVGKLYSVVNSSVILETIV